LSWAVDSSTLTRMQELVRYIEHTLFKPDASRADIEKLCAEAIQHGFHGVCVNGSRVGLAVTQLEETDLKVVALVGFPLGAGAADTKRYETEVAVDDGAHEIEFVPDLGRFKDGEHEYFLREIRDIVEAADERPVKVVLELGLLDEEQRRIVCEVIRDSGANFVTAPAGFAGEGGGVGELKLLRELLGPNIALKAAGNIPDAASAKALIDAGATRLGTTAGVAIVS
jgi:deoxyribose-phosphate aldolase